MVSAFNALQQVAGIVAIFLFSAYCWHEGSAECRRVDIDRLVWLGFAVFGLYMACGVARILCSYH